MKILICLITLFGSILYCQSELPTFNEVANEDVVSLLNEIELLEAEKCDNFIVKIYEKSDLTGSAGNANCEAK